MKGKTKDDDTKAPPPPTLQPLQLKGGSKSVGAATFSSMAKQAESLVSGDDSVVFDNYTDSVVFKSARLSLSDSLAVNVLDKSINNVNVVNFSNGTQLAGISDGYTVDTKGGMTPMYDPTIALSTVFGYESTQSVDSLRKDLAAEIERRVADSVLLTNKFQQTSADCEAAVRMVHYLNYDTENHRIAVTIPYEDETSSDKTFLDLMPAETITLEGESVYDPHTGTS